MSAITTHVLDTMRGKPVEGLRIKLEYLDADEGFREISQGVTDHDGRAGPMARDALSPGVFRLVFETDAYFESRKVDSFYPAVVIVFRVENPNEHHHVPLLLSPFGYSTYRGS